MCFLQSILSATFFDVKSWAQWNNPEPLSKVKIAPTGYLLENEIYKHFNLSDEEIDIVEENIKGI